MACCYTKKGLGHEHGAVTTMRKGGLYRQKPEES
uniref:Uncharacterized protein n=1 Tax=Vitis vinifera TaxID=29760 RepID=F6HSC3_VITVI